GLNAPGETVVIEREATRDHSERMLAGFGAQVSTETTREGRVITLTGQPELRPQVIVVPRDPSSAAFPVCAALITEGSDVLVPNIGLNPTRAGLFFTLQDMGADLTFENEREEGGEPVADLRARFSPEEVVTLTLEFYRRNYIEGLFLSSGIIRSPDETMGDMVRIARMLRTEHRFRGYIHLKTIPDAAPELIEQAGLYADRLSINVELPTDRAVQSYAPEKSPDQIRRAMADVRLKREARKERSFTGKRPARFAPAGQSTQMIVGADGADDATILRTSTRLYSSYRLKRVYYSAFSPIPDSSAALPLIKPPLMREHRLYQADWLLRFYGFGVDEIAASTAGGLLDLEVDPKLAWALANRHLFPVDVNRAERETLLRVPGLGTKTVGRILATRGHRTLRYEDLRRMGANLKQAKPFITLLDWRPRALGDAADLRARFAPPPEQLQLI
ncbi:putative DNA modification/repair radical SAM protein, partial [Salipiger sp. HF18]|uniref:putative DNA modification/repair radical SAM protein n=1 Tax=Salipiger sp. HF18 TaxID=2721557 RepID=UPI0020CB62BB